VARRGCGTAAGAHSQLNRVAQLLNERSSQTLGFETRAERDLMLVLHRPIEPDVKSGHSAMSEQCPLCPRKRTSGYALFKVKRYDARAPLACYSDAMQGRQMLVRA
jgi:hypothetical protein